MMRAARDTTIIYDDAGVGVVLVLGADYTAEHEHGISDLYRSFGIDPSAIGKVPGVESRVVARKYESLQCISHNIKPKKSRINTSIGFQGVFLVAAAHDTTLSPSERREMHDYQGRVRDDSGNPTDEIDMLPMSSAWSSADFGIFARKPKDITFLTDLFHAFMELDVVMWYGRMHDHPLRSNGLCLGIKSRMSEAQLQHFYDSDVARLELQQMDEAIGIRTRVKKSDKNFYALSPQMLPDDHSLDTKYALRYWLNPMDQHLYNSRWSTVEELDQWIDEKGPIVKC